MTVPARSPSVCRARPRRRRVSRDRPRRGLPAVGLRRRQLPRRHRVAVVLRGGSRADRDRRGRQPADDGLAAYHTFGRFTNTPSRRLAEALLELEPIADARVLFTNSGSEAIDSALKIARAGHRAAGQAGRTVFLSRHYAYHGVMLGGTSIGGLPANRTPYGPLLADTYQVDRDSVQAMRDAVAYHGADRIAAIFAEPVIGAGGVFPPGARLPGGTAGAVRRVRRPAPLRRGDHRLRPARLVVRQPSLRRHRRT